MDVVMTRLNGDAALVELRNMGSQVPVVIGYRQYLS
jgi:two-component system, response regulator PdtaR